MTAMLTFGKMCLQKHMLHNVHSYPAVGVGRAYFVQVAVLLNLAALYLATKEFADAAKCCTQALELEGCCAKALLRRAKARMHMHEYKVSKSLLHYQQYIVTGRRASTVL